MKKRLKELTDLSESMQDFEDEFVAKIQESVKYVKESREMEERFMLFQELLRDERAEGRAEGRANSVLLLLEEKGVIPETLREIIMCEKDTEVLEKWLKLAAKVCSVEQFLEAI